MITWDYLRHIARYPKEPRYEGKNFIKNMLCVGTAAALEYQIDLLKPRLVVEIGSWHGYSANLITDISPDLTLVCIDTWRGSCELYEMGEHAPYIDDSYDRFISNTFDRQDRVLPIKIDGVNGIVMLSTTDRKPELIFIDGGHKYESVWGDLHACLHYFPKATIVLDDWSQEGVSRAVTELCSLFGRQFEGSGNTATIKP